ncbi:MAG: hypothetical protein WCH62_05755 [Candidatus Omnitrophota bacterium]
MKKNLNKKSFTILEILLTVFVLGILLKLMIPKITGMKDNANIGKTNKEMNVLILALEAYRPFVSDRLYPPSTTSLQATYLSTVTPKVINSIFYDPFVVGGTTEYNYLSSPNRLFFIIWSVGFSGSNHPTAISDTGLVTYN